MTMEAQQIVRVAMKALKTVWQVDDYAVGRSLFREGWTELACSNEKQLYAFRVAESKWMEDQAGQQELSMVRPDDPTRWAWAGNYQDVQPAEMRDDWIGA